MLQDVEVYYDRNEDRLMLRLRTAARATTARATTAPVTSAPATAAAEATASEASAPEASAPEASAPEASAPEATAPATTARTADAANPAAGPTAADDAPAARSHLLAITRRAWVAARPALQAMVDLAAHGSTRTVDARQQQASQANHALMRQQVDARHGTRIAAPADAASPLLVTALRCGRRKSDGRWVLSFTIPGDEISAVLRETTMHAIVHALVTQEAHTGWGLPPLPMAQDTSEPQAASTLGRVH